MNSDSINKNMPSCNVCGNKSNSYLLSKDGYDLYKCDNCKLIYVWPQPAQEFLAQEVYSEKSGYQGNKDVNLANTKPDYKTQHILEFLLDNQYKNLLDVGCSNGEFIYLAEKVGIDSYGVELNPRTALIAQKNSLKVFQGTLETVKFEDNFFDAIYLGDIIEHVTNPRDLVERCARLLKKDGIIIISTPNMDCFWGRATLGLYKLFNIPPSTLTPPHHIFQFSEGNLNLLLKQSNFICLKTSYFKPPRLKYELGMIHTLKQYKKSGYIKDFIKMIYSYFLYTIAYLMNSILSLFKQKDFSMVSFYKKGNQI